MDKSQISEKDAESDMGEKVQSHDVEMEEGKIPSSPSRTAEPDSLPEGGDNLCTICGFSAKCPRSLKIHYARKHGKNSKYSDKTAKAAAKSENISDISPAENQQGEDMETESGTEIKQNQEPDLLEMKSVASDNGTNTKSLTKKQIVLDKQQAEEPTQERRVSKRTPKPKMIHSCNYCGQEFRDKTPLDVHIQRYHTKDTPYTLVADETMDDEEEAGDSGSSVKAIPTRVTPKHLHSRFQLKCNHCDFRVSTPALLESHARVKHLDQEWYRCKLCNFFSATPEWMDSHLSSDNHMQQQKVKKSGEGSPFELYVESVNRDSAENCAKIDDKADRAQASGEGVATLTEEDQETEDAVEAAKAVLVEGEDSELEPPRKKRGRPKQGSSTTCGYCGLVVSNATNLSVHVRRKHSKEYGYSCTLCNYSCVTKGDMDRHCITKKHVRRAQECDNKNPVNNHTSVSPRELPSIQVEEPIAASQTTDKEQEPTNTASKDDSTEEPACSYYAVTSREMSRHANTEKHKQKSQKYLEPLEGEPHKALALPLKLKEVTELSGDRSKPENEPASPTIESESCSDACQTMEIQNTAPSITTGPVDVVVPVAGGADEKQVGSIASSSGGGSDPADQTIGVTVLSEPQQAPADPQVTAEQHVDADVMIVEAKSNSSHSDTQMSKALPFDACIVSMKALAEQEQALQEDLALEGEATVICLTGGSSEKHFHCLVCGKSFYTESNLHQHLTSAAHLRNEQNSVEELPEGGASFKCVKCTDRFETEQDLFVHIKEKHEELLREVNKYVLEDTEQINREREENQGRSKPFRCKICNFATAQLGDARNHVKRHLGMREYKCDICG
ncbi:hypothetical protein INR49_012879 [Caranx melampygus]|nr:hypothetical protein INR49_012879 [Caranx melampygus]